MPSPSQKQYLLSKRKEKKKECHKNYVKCLYGVHSYYSEPVKTILLNECQSRLKQCKRER